MLCYLVLVALFSTAGATNASNATAFNPPALMDNASTRMFAYFFDTECLMHVTPIPGRVPLEDSFAFFQDHLGELRLDSTILSMLAFAGLVTVTLAGSAPKPEGRIGKTFFIFWAACQFIQCFLMLFAIIFAILAYVSLHEHYGSCLREWKDGSFPSMHLVVGLTTMFQPAIIQRLCALQCALLGLTYVSKQELFDFHFYCSLVQQACLALIVLGLGVCSVAWLASGAFIFSVVFLPSLLAPIAVATLCLLLLYCEGKAYALCVSLVADYITGGDKSTRHHASWVKEGFQSTGIWYKIRSCAILPTNRKALVSGFWRLTTLSVKLEAVAFFCLLWMAACPMVILGTWLAWGIYSGEWGSDEISEAINKAYAFAFEVFSVNFELQWPSIMDLTELSEMLSVGKFFKALKDFTDYSPTYLLTGSRAVSLLSFAFAILKTGSGMLLTGIDVVGGLGIGVSSSRDGSLLSELEQVLQMASRKGPYEGELARLLKTCHDERIDIESIYSVGYIEFIKPPQLMAAGWTLSEIVQQRQDGWRNRDNVAETRELMKMNVGSLSGFYHECHFSTKVLIQSGCFTPSEFKDVIFTNSRQIAAMHKFFSREEMMEAGWSCQELDKVKIAPDNNSEWRRGRADLQHSQRCGTA